VPTDIVMGVDLGLKVPAVAKTSTGKVKFLGNGRLNKFMKRRFRSLRKKLGKSTKPEVIKKIHDKEQRWMNHQDQNFDFDLFRLTIHQNLKFNSILFNMVVLVIPKAHGFFQDRNNFNLF
jgi:hypothetical protein